MESGDPGEDTELRTQPLPPGDVDRVPVGWSAVEFRGRRYGLTRRDHVDGRSLSVYAEELGGTDVISANLYRTSGGLLLRPCEMPAQKVTEFLFGWRPAE